MFLLNVQFSFFFVFIATPCCSPAVNENSFAPENTVSGASAGTVARLYITVRSVRTVRPEAQLWILMRDNRKGLIL